MRKFDIINFEHGVDPRYIAKGDLERAEKWLAENLLYPLDPADKDHALIFKLKTYPCGERPDKEFSFTIKVYEEQEANDPMAMQRFKPEAIFGEDFAGYMSCVTRRHFPSGGEERRNQEMRRDFHNAMTDKFEAAMRLSGIHFGTDDTREVNSHLRSIVEVIMSYHPEFNQRAMDVKPSDIIADRANQLGPAGPAGPA